MILSFVVLYTDGIISLLNIGEIWCTSLFRQNYFADDDRQDLVFLYTDGITSPLNIGEKAVLYIVV